MRANEVIDDIVDDIGVALGVLGGSCSAIPRDAHILAHFTLSHDVECF